MRRQLGLIECINKNKIIKKEKKKTDLSLLLVTRGTVLYFFLSRIIFLDFLDVWPYNCNCLQQKEPGFCRTRNGILRPQKTMPNDDDCREVCTIKCQLPSSLYKFLKLQSSLYNKMQISEKFVQVFEEKSTPGNIPGTIWNSILLPDYYKTTHTHT